MGPIVNAALDDDAMTDSYGKPLSLHDDDEQDEHDEDSGDVDSDGDEDSILSSRADDREAAYIEPREERSAPRRRSAVAASFSDTPPATFDPSEPLPPRVPLIRHAPPEHTNGHPGYFLPQPPSTSMGGALPLWPDHSDFDQTTQIVIKRREAEGQLSYLGKFPKDATIEMVLSKWPKAGTYFVYPVDAMGREIDAHNPTRIDVPEDHEFLLRRRRETAQSDSLVAGGMTHSVLGGVAPEVLALFEKLLSAKDEETKRALAEVASEKEVLRAKETEIAKRDQFLALREIEHIQTATNQVLEQARSQSDTLVERIMAMNALESSRAEAAAQRERDRSDALHRQAIEQQEASHKLMFAQMEAINRMHSEAGERERIREKEALEAEKARLGEQSKMQTLFMNAEAKRRQEVADEKERIAPKSGLEGIRESIGLVKELRELTGDEGEGDAPKSTSLVEKGFEFMMEQARQKHERDVAMIYAKAGKLPPGFGDDDDDDEGMPQAGPYALPGPVAGRVEIPSPYAGPQVAREFAGIGTPMPAVLNQAGAPRGLDGQNLQPPAVPYSLAAPGAVTATGDDPFSAARATVQQLVDRLTATPDRQQWADIIGNGLMAEPSTLDYLKATTVYGAMMDNGADDGIANEVCAAVEEMGIADPLGIPVR